MRSIFLICESYIPARTWEIYRVWRLIDGKYFQLWTETSTFGSRRVQGKYAFVSIRLCWIVRQDWKKRCFASNNHPCKRSEYWQNISKKLNMPVLSLKVWTKNFLCSNPKCSANLRQRVGTNLSLRYSGIIWCRLIDRVLLLSYSTTTTEPHFTPALKLWPSQ